MTPANDDGHQGGALTARAASEMAIGYAALAALASLVGSESVRTALADTSSADAAAALGKGVLASLDLLPVLPVSTSGIPLTRRRT